MIRTQMGGAGGGAVQIRQATPADLAALGDFFAGLTVESRFLRFFAPVRPSRAMLTRLAGGGAGIDAVVAVSGGVIIGHAMAADLAGADGRRLTDIGVVVADAWQGRGLGLAVARALLTRAAERGITAVTMDVLPGNRRVLGMIRAHGEVTRTSRCGDSVTVEIRLRPGRSGRGGTVRGEQGQRQRRGADVLAVR